MDIDFSQRQWIWYMKTPLLSTSLPLNPVFLPLNSTTPEVSIVVMKEPARKKWSQQPTEGRYLAGAFLLSPDASNSSCFFPLDRNPTTPRTFVFSSHTNTPPSPIVWIPNDDFCSVFCLLPTPPLLRPPRARLLLFHLQQQRPVNMRQYTTKRNRRPNECI